MPMLRLPLNTQHACMERWGDRLTRCGAKSGHLLSGGATADDVTARREASAISIRNCGRVMSLNGRFEHSGLTGRFKLRVRTPLRAARARRQRRERGHGKRRKIDSVERHMKFSPSKSFAGSQPLSRPRSAGPQLLGAPADHVAEEQDPVHLSWAGGAREKEESGWPLSAAMADAHQHRNQGDITSRPRRPREG